MFRANIVTTPAELQQILDLQRQNLRGENSGQIEKEQGFVTVSHTLDLLQHMHCLQPSVIVKDKELLAGFALVMLQACRSLVPELLPLFTGLNKLVYHGRPLPDYQFYVIGQVCVAAGYRGRGVFDMLYAKHKELFQHRFDFVITEIATRNTRSLRAHERVGFTTLHVYRDALDEWAVVLWDWT